MCVRGERKKEREIERERGGNGIKGDSVKTFQKEMLATSDPFLNVCHSFTGLVVGMMPGADYCVNLQFINRAGLGSKTDNYFFPMWDASMYVCVCVCVCVCVLI